ncbi:GntR family transcriptional regulator [uncultured Cohaesibacter sp.]|uniref:GntR family transcriptional regulator n=1 Tax=uncultured Cohaesibacter sp. TaxID=1002546 RepID=UPI0029C797E8|nr:GntR family transcriptional regulator [uncultured Cohaesibacter sp.]
MGKRYLDVAAQITKELKSGVFKVGDALPSEAVLCERFQASRSTVRAAMAELQRLGMIERKQGAPTRVLSNEPPTTYVHSMSVTGDLMQFAGPSWREVQEIVPLVADEQLAERLGDRPGRRWVLIRQTRNIEGQSAPVGWTDIYLSQEHEQIAEQVKDYPGLVYVLLEKETSIVIHEIEQSIRAVPVPDDLANALQVAAGDHALELRRQYRDANNNSQIITLSILPAKNYTYEITLRRQA